MFLRFAGGGTVAAAVAAVRSSQQFGAADAQCTPYSGPKATKVRTEDFPLHNHHHGKAKVPMRRFPSSQDSKPHA
jgi:hypothetical protein